MTDDTDTPLTEPIDADFEPATPEPEKPVRNSGPGWLGVGVASLMAAGVGGAIGVAFDGPNSPASTSGETAAISESLSVLQEAQTRTDQQLNKVTRDTGELETRLQKEIAALPAGSGDAASLAPLVAELEAVSKRLDEAMVQRANPEALNALQSRLEALEAIDTSGETSPEALTRAVTGLAQRVEKAEAAEAELRKGIAERDEKLDSLANRLTEAEFALESVRATGNGEAPESNTQIAALTQELAALRAEVDQSTADTATESEELAALLAAQTERQKNAQAEIDQAKSNTEAALALAAITTAARRGEPFREDYAKLSAAMPQNRSVRGLATLADTGVMTIDALKTSFQSASASAKAGNDNTQGKTSWLNRTFGDAISVRRANSTDMASDEILADAQDALDAGNLIGAVKQVQLLSAGPAAEMSDWTEQAKRRMSLDQGLEDIRLSLIEAER